MKEEDIRRLVKIVEESNIGELEITQWGRTIRITKSPNSHFNSASHQPSSAVSTTTSAPPQQLQQAPEETGEKVKEAVAKNVLEIRSPMVGTFYRAPAPDADPYVEVNDVVAKGQVLCLIEAMKLMNEIECEHNGRIVEILVENAQPVEYNQPLFRIEPS